MSYVNNPKHICVCDKYSFSVRRVILTTQYSFEEELNTEISIYYIGSFNLLDRFHLDDKRNHEERKTGRQKQIKKT